MNTQLLSCSTARESSAGFSRVSPTKVEIGKSFLFTESFLILKIKNTGLIFNIVTNDPSFDGNYINNIIDLTHNE